jgi:hypothetical protein
VLSWRKPYASVRIVPVHANICDGHLPLPKYNSKGKAIPLQALTGPEGSRRLRLPDFKTIGTWRWHSCQPYAPAGFTPRKYSWYSFLLEAESPQGHSAAGRIMSMKNSNETIGNRSRDLPVCSAMPQPTAPPRTHKWCNYNLPTHSVWMNVFKHDNEFRAKIRGCMISEMSCLKAPPPQIII